jgi:hypothetical protein
MPQIPSLPPTGIFADMLTGFRRICETINLLIKQVTSIIASGGSGVAAAGTYEPPFLSGSVQYNNNGALGGVGNFQWGFSLPNASGIPSQGILVGGAGAVQVVYITDEQLAGQKGITVIREAGDAASTGAANWDGGDLLDFAGGTLHGNGGTAKYQAGTSVSLRGGDAILHGGNSTTGIPGNGIVIGGETGSQGANVLLIATKLAGIAGDVRHQINSTVLQQFLEHGEIYLTLSGTGAGLAGQPLVSGGIGAAAQWLTTGFTGTITTAKLTTLGANGSMTFASGILISQTQAT